MMVAKELSSTYGMPFIAVNHLEAHVAVAKLSFPTLSYPFVAALVSGGNTQIVLARGAGECHVVEERGGEEEDKWMEPIGDYVVLGSTLDDAFGEVCDKAAVLLELPLKEGECWGAALVRFAELGNARSFPFPRPMVGRKGCDMSFCAFKSKLRDYVLEAKGLNDELRANLAASFVEGCVTHFESKLKVALLWAKAVCSDLVICSLL